MTLLCLSRYSSISFHNSNLIYYSLTISFVVQVQTIPHMLEHKNILCAADTGELSLIMFTF